MDEAPAEDRVATEQLSQGADSSIFEINDFTNATPWERYIKLPVQAKTSRVTSTESEFSEFDQCPVQDTSVYCQLQYILRILYAVSRRPIL